MSSSFRLAVPNRATEGVFNRALRPNAVMLVAFSWGLSAFFPIGVMYLNLLLMLCALAVSGGLCTRVQQLPPQRVASPIIAMLLWTVLIAAAGDWFPDTPTRIFHICRVALVLFLGLMLTPMEARAAQAGFLTSAMFAALVVAAHHVWGMPDWAIWNGLLSSRNNFSSGNMVTMATACGVLFFLGIRRDISITDRWITLAASLALGLTVALHSLSRNSQVLLAALVMAAVLCRFRSLRATLIGLLTVIVLAAAMWQLSPNTRNRFHEMQSNLEAAKLDSNYATSVGVRLRMYEEAIRGMGEHPLLGTGLGSWLPRWRTVWLALEDHLPPEAKLGFLNINNPHNDFLLAGMETGVMGMLILIWLLVNFVRVGWQRHSAAGGVTVMMGVSIFITALVNAPFRDAAFGMTLIWLLGVSVAVHKARDE